MKNFSSSLALACKGMLLGANSAVKSHQKPRYSGTPVLLKVKTNNGCYGVVLEIFQKNNPIISTAFKDTESNIDNWIRVEAIPNGTETTFSDTRLNDIITHYAPNFNPKSYNEPLFQSVNTVGAETSAEISDTFYQSSDNDYNINRLSNDNQEIKNIDGSIVQDVLNPLEYDYINNQVTGEKVSIEMNEDINVEEIKPQMISSALPFEISEKPSTNKKMLIESLNLNDKNSVELTNKYTQEKAILNKGSIEKSLSNIKISNLAYNDFCSILYNSAVLFKNAQKIISHNDTKKDTDLKIKRYSNIAKVNDNEYLLEFVLKDNGQIMLYSVDIINRKAVSAKRLQGENLSAPDTANNSITHIQELFKSRLVKKYNKDYSKINSKKNANNFNPNVQYQSNNIGIKGIKYNGQQDGECYVIFDDKAVQILNTFYQLSDNSYDINRLSNDNQEMTSSELFRVLPDDLKTAIEYIFNGEPVCDVKGDEFPNNGENLNERIYQYYKNQFNNVITNSIGNIKLDKRSIKDSIYHGINTDKVNAFVAVPYVLQKGKMLDVSKANANEHRYLFVAPLTLKGKDYYCEVVVKSNKDRQGFYIHEIELKEKLADVFSTAHHGTSTSSKSIITNLIRNFNPNVHYQSNFSSPLENLHKHNMNIY